MYFVFFFFNDTATTEIYTLSLHDALPIYVAPDAAHEPDVGVGVHEHLHVAAVAHARVREQEDAVGHDDVGRGDPHGLGAPGVREEVVHRLVDRLAGGQPIQDRKSVV